MVSIYIYICQYLGKKRLDAGKISRANAKKAKKSLK